MLLVVLLVAACKQPPAAPSVDAATPSLSCQPGCYVDAGLVCPAHCFRDAGT
jgi:hypothetical protein